ncbi:hypothetical protein LIA77_07758 [Sarocladium implicatum]|nr:hypothetical protein LIA77_07758 [Sarocladium implicatum]
MRIPGVHTRERRVAAAPSQPTNCTRRIRRSSHLGIFERGGQQLNDGSFRPNEGMCNVSRDTYNPSCLLLRTAQAWAVLSRFVQRQTSTCRSAVWHCLELSPCSRPITATVAMETRREYGHQGALLLEVESQNARVQDEVTLCWSQVQAKAPVM